MSNLARQAFVVTVSRLINQGLMIISPVVLVRLLTVEDFGRYREFLLYTTVLGNLAAFSLPNSLLYFIGRQPLAAFGYARRIAIALGVSPLAIMVFEVLLSSFALVTHANLALPAWLDRPIRILLVTPNMHRIHHSTNGDEQHRNFGFNLSLWDHLFASYAAHAREEPQAFGVSGVDPRDARRFSALLREPFVNR